jgi:hypothetical protein
MRNNPTRKLEPMRHWICLTWNILHLEHRTITIGRQ